MTDSSLKIMNEAPNYTESEIIFLEQITDDPLRIFGVESIREVAESIGIGEIGKNREEIRRVVDHILEEVRN